MRTSESIIHIAGSLLKAQQTITYAVTSAVNPHFRNRYADLSSVIDAIKTALNNNGIVFLQTPSPSEIGTLGLTTRLIHVSGEWIEDMAVIPLPKPDPQGYGSALTYARRYALAAITGLYQDDDDGNAATSGEKTNVTQTTTIKTPKAAEVPVTGRSSEAPRGDVAPVSPNKSSEIEFGAPPEGHSPTPGQTTIGPKTISDKQLGLLMFKARSAGVEEAKLDGIILATFGKKSKKELTAEELNKLLSGLDKKLAETAK